LAWAGLALAAAAQPAAESRAPQESAAAGTGRRISASDSEIAGFFDRFIKSKMEDLGIPGAAIVVVRDGRPILARGYGFADTGSRRPVDVENGLFRAASISKILPWLLAMQLVEEGRLDLDRDINLYLDFKIPEAFGRPITLRHLMTHSAGFPERFHGVFDPDLTTPLGKTLRDNIPERIYAPGSRTAYSNYGAALVGHVVARMRGQPWERVVQDRIFDPLAMARSTVAQPVPARWRGLLVSTYHWGSDAPAEFRTTPLAPMGALTASAADMGRLLAMLANEGAGPSGPVVSARTFRKMISLDRPLAAGLADGMGLGFFVGQFRGIRYAGHAGNMTALATDLEILPDHGLAWYYVFNSQGAGEGARKVRDELLRQAIGRFAAPDAPRAIAQGPSNALDVAGSYVSTRRIFSGPLMFSGLMNTTVVRAAPDGGLVIESSGAATRWLPAGRDRFIEAETGIALRATRGSGGEVERIASAALYPAAEFERAPFLVHLVPPIAAFSFGILFLSLLLKPVAWLAGRLRARKAGAGAPAPPTRPLQRWAPAAYWTIAATLAGWAAYALCLAFDFSLLFTTPWPVRFGLGLLTALSAPCAAILGADSALSFRDRSGGWMARTGKALVAAAAAGAAGLLYALDVANVSTAW
jgi:CubicO group peptidase (beta-lactamase class C family)